MPSVRILIIDDEPSFVSALTRLLSHDGATVDAATNGSLALVQIQTHRYDVILCDLLMPELNGPDFYAALLRQYSHLQQCTIFLTGDTLGAASTAFLEQCGRPWLHKPCNAAEVRNAMYITPSGRTMPLARHTPSCSHYILGIPPWA